MPRVIRAERRSDAAGRGGKETTVKTIRLSKAGHRTRLFAEPSLIRWRFAGRCHLKLERVATEEEEKDRKRFKSFSLSYTSNNRGEFAFRVPAARARYQITATLHGYKLEKKVVDVSESEAIPLSFSLEPVKK
jgi:hypothetical protein